MSDEYDDELDELLRMVSSSKTPMPPADLDGVEEEKYFSTLDEKTSEEADKLIKLEEKARESQIHANEITQSARKNILRIIKWPLLLGSLLISLLILISFFVVIVLELKIGLKLICMSTGELLSLFKQLPTGVVVLGGLAAPLTALFAALIAWLFKAPKKKK